MRCRRRRTWPCCRRQEIEAARGNPASHAKSEAPRRLTESPALWTTRKHGSHVVCTELVGDAGLLFRRETPEGILHIDLWLTSRQTPVSAGVVYLWPTWPACRTLCTTAVVVMLAPLATPSTVQYEQHCASNVDPSNQQRLPAFVRLHLRKFAVATKQESVNAAVFAYTAWRHAAVSRCAHLSTEQISRITDGHIASTHDPAMASQLTTPFDMQGYAYGRPGPRRPP
jgi:hypothetical protein